MARMTITGFEDVEEMLNKLANPYEMAEKAVNKAAPIVEKTRKHRSDPQLTEGINTENRIQQANWKLP